VKLILKLAGVRYLTRGHKQDLSNLSKNLNICSEQDQNWNMKSGWGQEFSPNV